MKKSKRMREVGELEIPGTAEELTDPNKYEVFMNGEFVETRGLQEAERLAKQFNGKVWATIEEDGVKAYCYQVT